MAERTPSTLSIWARRAKLTSGAVVAAGIGFLIGLYIVAPMFARASELYVPEAMSEMETGTIRISTADGTAVILPVRIAATYDARSQGLREVGTEVLETTFLLYDRGQATTYTTTYNMEEVQAPLSLAIIDAKGKVIAVEEVGLKDDWVSVEQEHRWALAVKKGLLEELGIRVGAALEPEAVRKVGSAG